MPPFFHKGGYMKTLKEANTWWDRIETEGALYVWGMNGEIISDRSIDVAYNSYKSSTYNRDYYDKKLRVGRGRIGADCSGAFYPLAGSDNTAAGYYSGCISKGKIDKIPMDTPCMVFKRNASGRIIHIGWYRPEDKTVSEMASSQVNFRRKKLSGAGWSDWGIPRFIDYAAPSPEKKSGWVQEDGGWRFYYRDNSGRYVANDWYDDGEKWYWFDGAGMMVQNTWYQYKGEWYFLGSDGAMIKGLQNVDGKWYYMDEDGVMATKPVTLTPDRDGALQYPGIS